MRKYIGNRQFYKMVLAVAVPIMIQNGITNFVSLLDNIMVGQIGTVQMSGVAIANNLIFVYNICIFGAVSGAGIFGAQFYGNGSHDGVRHTLRFKLIICAILFAAALLIFIFGGDALISLYLKGSGSAEDISATFGYGRNYLDIMLIGFIPFTIAFVYASTLRECGETFVPMVAGVVAVVINLVFNYILIFGHFGAPKMGVAGAAIATVISRFVECLIVLIWTHRHTERNPFIVGLYKSLKIPGKLVLQIIKKGSPLMINEALWSAGMAILLQCYSYRGLDVVAGQNISSTVANVFNVVFLALGNSVGIIIGQLLGAGKMEEAVDKNRKLIFFAVSVCFVIGTAMVFAAPVFPKLYNTTAETRLIAGWLIMAQAMFMPQNAFLHATYFTLRSGGKTIVTFLFDSVFVWCVSVPIAFVLSRYTALSVVMIFAFVQMGDWIKCVIGFILVKKGVWLQNIVAKE